MCPKITLAAELRHRERCKNRDVESESLAR